jgi:hypothetical protein
MRGYERGWGGRGREMTQTFYEDINLKNVIESEGKNTSETSCLRLESGLQIAPKAVSLPTMRR